MEKLDALLEKLGLNLLLLGKIVLIVAIAFALERIILALLRRAYKRGDRGREDVTRYRFLRNATRFVVGLVAIGAIIYSIPSARTVAVTLLAGAGILVAILGLAAQKAFSNIISGVFIVSFKPFRVGDTIQLGDPASRPGLSGVVEDITLRHTVIVNAENKRVIVPNAVISDEVIINSTIRDESICVLLEMMVSHESDLDKAMGIMAEEAHAHPSCLDRRTAEELEAGEVSVPVRVVRIADNGPVLRANIWAVDPVRASLMHHDLNKAIKQRFDREGIEIPYPHRIITYKKGPRSPNALDHEESQTTQR